MTYTKRVWKQVSYYMEVEIEASSEEEAEAKAVEGDFDDYEDVGDGEPEIAYIIDDEWEEV